MSCQGLVLEDPETALCSVEYIAPQEYMVRPSTPCVCHTLLGRVSDIRRPSLHAPSLFC